MSERKFWNTLTNLNWILRFLLVFLVFNNPLLAIATSLFLDGADAGLAYRSFYSWRKYTKFDKLLDYWWYIFILLYCLDTPLRSVMIVLFVFRSIGQFLVLLTNKHTYLMIFPNIFENYFILYIVVLYLMPGYASYFVGARALLPLLIATVTKLPQEYLAHRKGMFYKPNGWANYMVDEVKR